MGQAGRLIFFNLLVISVLSVVDKIIGVVDGLKSVFCGF